MEFNVTVVLKFSYKLIPAGNPIFANQYVAKGNEYVGNLFFRSSKYLYILKYLCQVHENIAL